MVEIRHYEIYKQLLQCVTARMLHVTIDIVPLLFFSNSKVKSTFKKKRQRTGKAG